MPHERFVEHVEIDQPASGDSFDELLLFRLGERRDRPALDVDELVREGGASLRLSEAAAEPDARAVCEGVDVGG